MTKDIKELLPSLLKSHDNWKFVLLNSWQTILGSLSSEVTLEKIQEDTLVLGIQNSCWLQELYLLSPILIKTINKTLDQPRIKHLRFKTKGLKKGTVVKEYKKSERTTQVTLTELERNALKKIKDPQLSQALKNFLIRCYQENV